MFERYTEEARRVIFFARYEASAGASGQIDTAHLLLALLREGGGMMEGLLQPASSIERLRTNVVAAQPGSASGVSTSVDLPLSHDAKRVLAYASEESERLEHRHIDVVHLLLGLLRDPGTSSVLIAHGLSRENVLAYATSTRPPEGTLGARFRLAELVRSMPSELLAEAEHALRAVLNRDNRKPKANGGEQDV